MNFIISKSDNSLQYVVKKDSTKLHVVAKWRQNGIMKFTRLKEELQKFCRENGISASGSKIEITDRIAVFLETGKIQKPLRKRSTSAKQLKLKELSLDTVITENHRCSQVVMKKILKDIKRHK